MGRIGLEKGFWGTKGQKGEKGREERGWEPLLSRQGCAFHRSMLFLSFCAAHAKRSNPANLVNPVENVPVSGRDADGERPEMARQARGRSAAGRVFGQDLQDGQDCLREWEKMSQMWLGRGREGLGGGVFERQLGQLRTTFSRRAGGQLRPLFGASDCAVCRGMHYRAGLWWPLQLPFGWRVQEEDTMERMLLKVRPQYLQVYSLFTRPS